MNKLILSALCTGISLNAAITSYSSKEYGYIYNKPVKNLHYEGTLGIACPNPTGVTDEDGAFYLDTRCLEYKFYIDTHYEIGLASISTTKIQELSSLHSNKNIVFLTNLVGANTEDSTNTDAIKLTQFFMSFDNDLNPNNGIDLNTSNIISKSTQDNISYYSTSYLQSLLEEQFGTNNNLSSYRTLFSTQCATSYLEYILNNNPFVAYSTPIDTVGPCTPSLSYKQLATSSSKTYLEVLGEAGTEIIVNGVKTGKVLSQRDSDLYPTGIYEELELDTNLIYNTFDEFNISLIDSKGKYSEDQLEIKIFNDTDQPYFGTINQNITLSSNSAQEIIDLNISDSSKDNGLSLIYELNDTRFDFNETNEILSYDGKLNSGTYSIKLKVKDEAWHREEKDFNITIP